MPAWYRETILSIALREGFHRCARVAVGHPKNPKKLCLPRKSLACPVLARCLPVVASLLARLSRPRQDGLERSGEGEREGGRESWSERIPSTRETGDRLHKKRRRWWGQGERKGQIRRRSGRECRDNEEADAGCGERDNTHDRCGDDGDKSRDNGREERERERERETLLRTVSRTQSHTHSYGYGHYVLNILRSTLTCLIQTGESCCLRFVGDSRADVIRVHAFLPLWFQSTDPVPDWSCSSYSRVSCPADGRACFVRSLAGRARGEATASLSECGVMRPRHR